MTIGTASFAFVSYLDRCGSLLTASTRSVANVSQIIALDKGVLGDAVGRLSRTELQAVLSGVDVVLGRG